MEHFVPSGALNSEEFGVKFTALPLLTAAWTENMFCLSLGIHKASSRETSWGTPSKSCRRTFALLLADTIPHALLPSANSM